MEIVLLNSYSLEEVCLPYVTEELLSYIILYWFSWIIMSGYILSHPLTVLQQLQKQGTY